MTEGRSRASQWESLAIRSTGLVLALGLALVPAKSEAQSFDCGDTLSLLSPETLTVDFVAGAISGNRLSWPALPGSTGACAVLEVPSALAATANPQIIGGYRDLFDRFITFRFDASGTIAGKASDVVPLAMLGDHPNGDVPPVLGTLNLSNRGGIFELDLDNGTGVQINEGVPAHLPRTDVDAVAVSGSGATERRYASVEGIPLLRSDAGGAWFEPANQAADPVRSPITTIAIDPADPDHVFLGTRLRGLYESRDGGATISKVVATFNEGQVEITDIQFLEVELPAGGTEARFYVSTLGAGVHLSRDGGLSFSRLTELQVAAGGELRCPGFPPNNGFELVRRPLLVRGGKADASRIYASVDRFGIFRSDDAGATWTPASTGLIECEGDSLTGRRSVTRLLVQENVDSPGEDFLLAATSTRGLFASFDSGDSWQPAGNGYPVDAVTTLPVGASSILPGGTWRTVYIATESRGIWQTDDLGSTWSQWGDSAQLSNPKVGAVVALPNGNFLAGTVDAGVYRSGVEIDLSRAVDRSLLDSRFADAAIDLGLGLSLSSATVDSGVAFDLRAQSVQGYAVWRATDADPSTGEPRWLLIGLYDLSNPESCFEGDCDDPSTSQSLNCFADKRANCFNFSVDGSQVTFFDKEIYNGFRYTYAVTSYDYGFTGNINPLNFAGEMLYSPRSAQESSPEAILFMDGRGGAPNYNARSFQVNVGAAQSLDEAYVVPNPLRREAGWDSENESSLRIVNVTVGTRCEIFTLAGDLVVELENVVIDDVERGNIEWDTRNSEGEQVASGVYIYRLTNENGEEFISRLTIIR